MNDIVINKVQSIHRCIDRAREYHLAADDFATDFRYQDAAILNIIRACEQAIDLANYVIKSYKMGIPTSSAESFHLLAQKNVITHDLKQRMEDMVGFRNIAVHQYQRLDMAIVESVIVTDLDDLIAFGEAIMVFFGL